MCARTTLLLLLPLLFAFTALAQTIRGEVLDKDDKRPIADMSISNIHTGLVITTDDHGAFIIAASGGQLLEFKKNGYKTVRVRIPLGLVPPFFRILVSRGIPEIMNDNVARSIRYDYTQDSIRYHDIYAFELDYPRLSGMDIIAHPFSALDPRNREIWRFQDEYNAFEKEKYVDRTFNESVITRFTGLTGDSLHYYMRHFRPTYEQLRNMNDYTFFNFIKTTVHKYRNLSTPRGAQ